MKKLFLIPFIALVIVSLILGGCAKEKPTPTTPPTTTKPPVTTTAPPVTTRVAPYGTIRQADADYGWESTDPVYYESFIGWSIYDSLLSYDKEGNFIPDIAESWTYDGITWTFKIRKGIKFHNGDPLTAHDVKFSVDRFGDMSLSTNPWSYYISTMYNKKDSIVVDDYTYQFVDDHPEPAQAIVFAWTRILPKNYYEKVGMDEFRKHPIGTGPWKFVELIPETSYKLEANTDYWIPEGVPYYQYIQSVQVPEEATRIAMLKNHEVDIAGVNFDRMVELLADKSLGFRTEELGLPMQNNINIQGSWLPESGPVYDIRVRQALSYSLNRQEIADNWYQGFAEPGGMWFMYEGSYGWSDALKADPYDPGKARVLLAQAGYPTKFADPYIHIYTTAAGQDYILLLISYWEAVGIKVKLEVVDSTVWGAYFFTFTRMKAGDPNVGWIFFWGFGDVVNCTYHSANMYTNVGCHNTCNDQKATDLYKAATLELDSAKALKLWTEFQAYVRTLYIDIGIVLVKPVMLVGPDLGEFTGKNYMSLADAYNGIKHPAK